MSKGGKPKQAVTDYFASLHYGVCRRIDSLIEIKYGEKTIWTGNASSNTRLNINRRDIFGGNKQEGGFQGSIDVMLGGDNQLLSEDAAKVLKRNGISAPNGPLDLPGYRRKFTAFIFGGGRGSGGSGSAYYSGAPGAFIGSNTAYIKAFSFKIRSRARGMPFDPVIMVEGMELANPAAMIWEVFTDKEWGMGLDPLMMDAPSWTASATALRNEGFGLAMLWKEQEKCEDFVAEILSHIDATAVLNPFTGLYQLNLIRPNYNEETLPIIGPHNAVLEKFTRMGPGETVNEISVVWTNPINEQEETVTVNDIAAIAALDGQTISETRSFIGVRNPSLALRLADRELLASSTLLASAELSIFRGVGNILPGQPFVLTWPQEGIEKLVMRATDINYGSPSDPRIRIGAIEDIFSMPAESVVSYPGSGWVNPATPPTPLPYARAFELPYYVLSAFVGDEEAEQTDPDTSAGALIGAHSNPGALNFDVAIPEADSLGQIFWNVRARPSFAPRGTIGEPVSPAVTSAILIRDLLHDQFIEDSVIAWIGDDVKTAELVVVTGVNYVTDRYTVNRGILDTVPKSWPVGTPVWFLPESSIGRVNEILSVGQNIGWRGLTRTSLGVLPVTSSPIYGGEIFGRTRLPYRPANLRANNVLFPDPNSTLTFPVNITWSSRNRLEETTLILAWNQGAVLPEEGTEYRVTVNAVGADGTTVIGQIASETQTASSYQFTMAMLTGSPYPSATYIQVQVASVRDTFVSLQPAVTMIKSPLAPIILDLDYKPPSAPGDLIAEVI